MSFCFHTIEIKSCKKNLHKKSHSIPLSWTDMMQTHQESLTDLKREKNYSHIRFDSEVLLWQVHILK